MSYATIEEVWGSAFGTTQSSTTLNNLGAGKEFYSNIGSGGDLTSIQGSSPSLFGPNDSYASIQGPSLAPLGNLKSRVTQGQKLFAPNEPTDVLDKDLMNGTAYDEFNIPLKTTLSNGRDGISPSNSGMEDYYRLLNNDDYSEEVQYDIAGQGPNKGSRQSFGGGGVSCEMVINHVRTCKTCRAQLIAELELQELLNIKSDAENSENASTFQLQDIILFIAAGAFIVFLMDSLVKLGAYLNK